MATELSPASVDLNTVPVSPITIDGKDYDTVDSALAALKAREGGAAAGGGEPPVIIRPETLARANVISSFPTSSGVPDDFINNATQTFFDAQYDFGPAINHAFYEARKRGPRGASVMFSGAYKFGTPIFFPPVNCVATGLHYYTQLLCDGPDPTLDMAIGGNLAACETSIPISAHSVGGGQTVITLGVGNCRHRLVAERVADAPGTTPGRWWDLDYTDGEGSPVVVDPWGEWFVMVGYIGVTDGTSYQRLKVLDFDVEARTITLQGEVTGYTPTEARVVPRGSRDSAIKTGGIGSPDAKFDARDDVHPMHRFEMIGQLSLEMRRKGGVWWQYQRGVKGRPDPATRFGPMRVRNATNVFIDQDSDSHCEFQVGASDGDMRMSGVDSAFYGLVWAATEALRMNSDCGQNSYFDKLKGYYTEKGADGTVGVIDFETNSTGHHFVGMVIGEDSTGGMINLAHRCANIHFAHMEMNNIGAFGLGAPATVGWKPWSEGYGFKLARNAAVSNISAKHIILRSNRPSRDGQHVRALLDVEAPNKLDPDTGLPWFSRRIHLEAESLNIFHSEQPMLNYEAEDVDTWDAGTIYTDGDVVSLTGTPWDVRWECAVPSSTPGVRPDSDDPKEWFYVGGMRNAWRGAFWQDPPSDVDRTPEFADTVLVVDGARDPTYHERELVGLSAYTIDFQHNLARIDPRAGGTRIDAYVPLGRQPGSGEYFRQTIRAGSATSTADPVTLEPGLRNGEAADLDRVPTAPAWPGMVATLTRPGAEMRIEHRYGEVHVVPHDQIEEIADGDLQLDLSDNGKTLHSPASGTRTWTVPALSDVSADWQVTIANTGSGTISLSGPFSGNVGPGEIRTLRRLGSAAIVSAA